MSVYKPKGSPFYHFDFRRRGNRYRGTTERTSRREAEQVEREARERAKRDHARATAAATSMQLADVAARYWVEAGKHSANRNTTERDLARLVEFFTPTKLLSEISDSEVAQLVAWRRGHHVIRGAKRKPADCPLISNATVNRSSTELLRRLFSRAKKAWGARFEHEPRWRSHLLPEPQERVRELASEEGARLEAAARADYAPFFAFAQGSGLRLRECLLRWSDVNWDTQRIQKLGKGARRVTVPVTSAIRDVLWPLRGHHPEFVFTYIARRTTGKHVKGRRFPLTYSGVKTQWRRLRKRAGVKDFRFHDLRHDLATKLLRETGNLKLVQRAMNHSDLKTTARYAHVLDSDVAAALDKVAAKRMTRREAEREAFQLIQGGRSVSAGSADVE